MTTPNDAPLTDAEVAAFRELASKLIGEEWLLSDSEDPYVVISSVSRVEIAEVHNYHNARFISAARNIADRLAREVQEKTLSVNNLMDQVLALDAQLAAANERLAELEFSRAEAEALVMSHEGKIDQLRQQLAEYEKHYARERYTNELAAMEQNWKEREAALKQQLAELEAEIDRQSGKLAKCRESLRAYLSEGITRRYYGTDGEEKVRAAIGD